MWRGGTWCLPQNASPETARKAFERRSRALLSFVVIQLCRLPAIHAYIHAYAACVGAPHDLHPIALMVLTALWLVVAMTSRMMKFPAIAAGVSVRPFLCGRRCAYISESRLRRPLGYMVFVPNRYRQPTRHHPIAPSMNATRCRHAGVDGDIEPAIVISWRIRWRLPDPGCLYHAGHRLGGRGGCVQVARTQKPRIGWSAAGRRQSAMKAGDTLAHICYPCWKCLNASV